MINNILAQEVAAAQIVVQSGGILLYPTETVWGLGCAATNAAAIQRIYHIKGRDANKPLLVLMHSREMLLRYVGAVPPQAEALLHPDAPPTTIIYPHIRHLPHHLLAADGSLGIRMARHPFCEQLIAAIDAPLVSTSANFSGEPAAVHFADLSAALRKQVDYTVSDLSAYYEPRGLPSRIVRLSAEGNIEILRN
ncbi:MAG: threonylcarbamoyl-AMP synthase [Sphingobacteriales bacterium]|nr:threonylcarbamoyl-AMP synthase [Sphingobacteriales bacterium]